MKKPVPRKPRVAATLAGRTLRRSREHLGMLHDTVGKTRLDGSNSWDAVDSPPDKVLICLKAFDDDSQEIVAIARHEIALEDFIDALHFVLECLDRLLRMNLQLDANENRDRQPIGLLIDECGVA